jgi:hypothetical protein
MLAWKSILECNSSTQIYVSVNGYLSVISPHTTYLPLWHIFPYRISPTYLLPHTVPYHRSLLTKYLPLSHIVPYHTPPPTAYHPLLHISLYRILSPTTYLPLLHIVPYCIHISPYCISSPTVYLPLFLKKNPCLYSAGAEPYIRVCTNVWI